MIAEPDQTSSINSSPKNDISLLARTLAYLQLMRPANIVTALADILAGFAVSGAVVQIIDVGNGWFYIPEINKLLLLLISTAGLYGGGVVLNDFFDAELDKIERPERPIPSGRASKTGAFILAVVLLSVGIQAASFASFAGAFIATAIAVLAVIYDAWGKHQKFLGMLNMGLCRAGNLLLGMSIVPASITELWFVSLIPVLYIAAVTMVSRGEVHGGEDNLLRMARWMYIIVLMLIAALAFHPYFQLRLSLPYLVVFSAMIFTSLHNARKTGLPEDIGKAVKFGVLAIILMDAALAGGFAGWEFALVIICLLPISLIMAKVFAVT